MEKGLEDRADGKANVRVTSDLPYLEAKWRKAKFKLWTKARERQLEELHGIGLDPAIIALEMQLGERTVRARMVRLGLLRSYYER